MDALDFEARNSQGASAGNITPTKSLGSVSIRDKIMFTPAVEPSQAMMSYINLLFSQIPQFITGAFPALFGGKHRLKRHRCWHHHRQKSGFRTDWTRLEAVAVIPS